MTDKLFFTLSTPERELTKGNADKVDIPGASGWFSAMPGHTPILSMLHPGVVRIWNGESRRTIYVEGGFVDVSSLKVTILANKAIPTEELSPPLLDQDITKLQEALMNAKVNESRRLICEALEELKKIRSVLE